MTLVQLFDRLFQYMPPLARVQDSKEPETPTPQGPDTDPEPLSLHERLAAGRTFTPPIPGQIGAGGLSPEQQAHVRQLYQRLDTVTPQLEAVAKKAISVFTGSTGAAIGAGQSAGDAIASGAAAAGPAVIMALDAAALGIAAVDIMGGDVAIPTYAPLNPEFDASTAAGRFHGMAEAQVINSSLAETGGAVKFRTSGRLTDDSIAG